MNKTSITICFILFACLLISSQCLKGKHLKNDLKSKINHKLQKMLHIQEQTVEQSETTDSVNKSENEEDQSSDSYESLEEQIPQGFATELFTFVMSDSGLASKAANGERLSAEEAAKIKTFLSGNEDFKQIASSGSQDDKCYSTLTKEQQDRYVSIILDNMNFETFFTQDDSFGVENDKLTAALTQDKDLSDAFAACATSKEAHRKKTLRHRLKANISSQRHKASSNFKATEEESTQSSLSSSSSLSDEETEAHKKKKLTK